MTIGEKIQILRKQHGMSQEQLGVIMAVSRQAISKWEVGESIPDVDNVVQLSEIFGVTTDYILKNGANHDPVMDEELMPVVLPSHSRKHMLHPSRTGVLMIIVGIAVVFMSGIDGIMHPQHSNMIFPIALVLATTGGIMQLLQSSFSRQASRITVFGAKMAMASILLFCITSIEGVFSHRHSMTLMDFFEAGTRIGLIVVIAGYVIPLFRKRKKIADFIDLRIKPSEANKNEVQ